MNRLLVLLVFTACDSGGDPVIDNCVELCTEAQDGACTTVTGDCGDFCVALDGVAGPAGCAEEYDRYESCLEAGVNVCDSNCDVPEGTLAGCIAAFCQDNPDDPDCQVLIDSF